MGSRYGVEIRSESLVLEVLPVYAIVKLGSTAATANGIGGRTATLRTHTVKALVLLRVLAQRPIAGHSVRAPMDLDPKPSTLVPGRVGP